MFPCSVVEYQQQRAIKSYLGSRACVDVDFHVLN
jgi:hypothetical protein